MDDRQFRRLLHYLGLSWTGYRKVRKGVKRRISRHMLGLNCSDMAGYLHELDRNAEARDECKRLMTVSISRFFRDRRLWDLLHEEILPGLIEENPGTISVWSAGCASGEEAYSLKILYNELESSTEPLPALEITATDMNPVYLNRARVGRYPASSLKEVPEKLRTRSFHPEKNGAEFRLKEALKSGISWRVYDLLSGPHERRFQIIFLRNNILTYYRDETKKVALKDALTSLCTGGFLIIGSHEKLPFEISEILHEGPVPYLFKKKG
jgi:chemotaxis protein methyltransferase CheR